MSNKPLKLSDIFVIGFAMFAVFFGAGNLIFPPYLGMESGSNWFLGFFCFVLADVGLAILTTLVLVRLQGTGREVLTGLGAVPSRVVMTIVMLIVGPLLCIPRTGATTYEMAIQPILPNCPSWLFGLLFFGFAFLLTIRSSKVVDIIGKVLTPMLLVTLAVLVVKGIFDPIGEIGHNDQPLHIAKTGFLAGYQTMDVLGAIIMAMLVASSAVNKGYVTAKSKLKVVAAASVVASASLFVVYCGLTYLGATTSLTDVGDVNQTGLVVLVTELLLKRVGVYLLALIVFFACLTTAVGLISTTAEYFSNLAMRRVSYAAMSAIMALCGAVISSMGISQMIAVATPILNVLYPLLLTQIILSIFYKQIHRNGVYLGAALGAMAFCIPDTLNSLGLNLAFLHKLPLASLGFGWVLPALAGALLGALLSKKEKHKTEPMSSAVGQMVV